MRKCRWIERTATWIEDKRALKLIRAFLKARVMENELAGPSVDGPLWSRGMGRDFVWGWRDEHLLSTGRIYYAPVSEADLVVYPRVCRIPGSRPHHH